MRFFALAALAALTFGLLDARPASAATWQCVGGDYVCGGSAASPKKTVSKGKVAHTQYSRQAQRGQKAHKVAHAKKAPRFANRTKRHQGGDDSVVSSGSYGGGGSVGMASYYWEGQMTASGARFNPGAMTAAHRSLPFGTRVLVTHLASGRSVTVTINDRGPFVKGRIIDLSSAAAGALGIKGAGVAKVSVSVLGRG